ncbi:MAG: TonB family protein [Polyangiaceae bacterium]
MSAARLCAAMGLIACLCSSGVAIAQPEGVVAPHLLESRQADYPDGATGEGRVVVTATVERDGTVSAATVDETSGEAALDASAIDCARQWRFEPATRGGEPIRSRVRLEIDVVPPTLALTPSASSTSVSEAAAATETKPGALEVTAEGERRPRGADRGASNFVLDREVLAAAPSREGADVLARAPGMFIGRSGGMAVAHRYSLRGFDADHGQDIAFSVGGLPINMPSHIHGQGYADLGLLIGEAVRRLQVIEGVYDPRQGDFAVAGSVGIDLGVEARGWRVKSSYGAFNTFRQLAMWAPEGTPPETFGAASYTRTDGFGTGRQGAAASAAFQARLGASGPWSYRVIALAHAARAGLAGVLREDDVRSGRVGFYDSYPFPTAQRQNAFATRVMAGGFADFAGNDGVIAQLGLWLGYDDFRLQHNFTGFVQESRTLANVAGRGDLIEQQNRTTSVGLTSHYRTRNYEPAPWTRGSLELGLDGRFDVIDQAQNLLDATVRSETWDRRVDASVRGGNVGLWGDVDWSLPYLRARVGMRAAALFYDVDDRLGNYAPLIRPDDSYIIGFRRSAFGLAVGPRTSLEILPLDWLSIRAAYGEGYRSPQARTLDDGEKAPFTKVRSGDVGLKLAWDRRLELTLAGYLTHLSDDVAFEAREGRLERIGASRRLGGVLHVVARPASWLVAAASVTVVDAVLLEPPPPTAEDPQPPFVDRQRLPYVPSVLGRVDAGARHTLLRDLGGQELRGRIGTGATFLGPRPLPFGGQASPAALLDAGAAIGWGPLELGMDVFNILDVAYAASVFNFPSDWDPDTPRRRTPEVHTAAGPPLSWLASLEVKL